MSNCLHNVWSFANGSLLPNLSTPTRSSQTQAILDTMALHPRSRRVYWIVVPQIRNEEYIITARGVSFSMPSLVVINYSRHLTRRPHASFRSHEVCSPAFHNKTSLKNPHGDSYFPQPLPRDPLHRPSGPGPYMLPQGSTCS